jgi:hypothetical protein
MIKILRKVIQHTRCAKSPDFEQITLDPIATPLNKEFPEIPIVTDDVVEKRGGVKLFFFGIFTH